MKEKLMNDVSRVYDAIQSIDAPMTKKNAAIVLDALEVMQNVFVFLNELNASEEGDQKKEESKTKDVDEIFGEAPEVKKDEEHK